MNLPLAWVKSGDFSSSPDERYREVVADFYSRGAHEDGPQEADVPEYVSVSFNAADIVRAGRLPSADYGDGSRLAVGDSLAIPPKPDDGAEYYFAISQADRNDGEDREHADFIQAVAVVAQEGSVEFPGRCSHLEMARTLDVVARELGAKEGDALSSLVDRQDDALRVLDTAPEMAATEQAEGARQAWATRDIRQRTVTDIDMPPTVESSLQEMLIEFVVAPSARSTDGFLCFLTSEGWSYCTVIDVSGEGDLPGLAIPVPRGSWVEVYALAEPPPSTEVDRVEPLLRIDPAAVEEARIDPGAVEEAQSSAFVLEVEGWGDLGSLELRSVFSRG